MSAAEVASPTLPDFAIARTANARVIIEAAQAAGIDEAALLREVRLPSQRLAPADGIIEQRHVTALWDTASRMLDDPCFGLHVAERQGVETFGLVGFAVRSCANGREAAARAVDWLRRYVPDSDWELSTSGGVTSFRWRNHHPALVSRHGVDYVVATFVLGGRYLLDVDWEPCEVAFQAGLPDDPSEHRRIFRSPLRFGAEWSEIRFADSLLEQPLRQADRELFRLLEGEVEAMLRQLPAAPSATTRAREDIGRMLQHGAPVLADTAQRLGTSKRSLQRALSREGTSYRAVRDTVQREAALRLLRDLALTAEEVAKRIGFRDTSAFHRAFRRWTGTTPAAFRDA